MVASTTKTLGPGDDIQLLRNLKTINDAIPFAYKLLIKWGCPKKANESFSDYISARNEPLNKEEKKWIKINTTKLMNVDCEDVDVTFLFSLITHVCSKICKPGTSKFNTVKLDKTSVEYLLKKTKGLRNDVVHEPQKTACPSVFGEVRETLMLLIRAAGKLYDRSQNDIDREIQTLSLILKDIQLVVFNEQKKIRYVSEVITEFGWQERKSAWEDSCKKVSLPFSHDLVLDRSSTFHNIEMSFLKTSRVNLNEQNNVIFSCSELMATVKNKVKVIKGVPGSGKTTFLKSIIENWLRVGVTSCPFSELEQFDLVIFTECRTDDCKTFGELVKKNFPKTLASLSEKEIDEATELLKVLVLIDGYDERREHSEKLVLNIIQSCKFKVDRSVIISARPLACNDLLDELIRQEITFDIVTIEGVKGKQEQIQFLERYQKNIHVNNLYCKRDSPLRSSTDMIETFKKLSKEVSRIFVFPIFLALFCYLYENDASSVEQWRSERNVFQAVYELSKQKIKERIADDGCLSDLELRSCTRKLMREICRLSLRLINENCYFLPEKEYDNFCESCYRQISNKIKYDHVLSSIFSPENSVFRSQGITYHFLHGSTQEYFATRFLCEELEKEYILSSFPEKRNKIKMVVSKGINGQDVASNDLKRYSNVFKYLSQELLENPKLASFSKDLCKCLGEMGAGYSYCVQLIIASENNVALCKNISEVICQEEMLWQFYTSSGRLLKLILRGWKIQDGRQMLATAKLLKYCKPNTLSVFLPTDEGFTNDQLLALTQAVRKENFSGNLKLYFKMSRFNISPNDDVIMSLKNAKCYIAMFLGCVSSREALQVLSSMIGRSILAMSIPDPINHSLHLLKGKFSALGVWVPYVEVPDFITSDCRRPLPSGFPVVAISALLHVDNIPENGAKHVERIITYLAPNTLRFTQLALDHCQLSDDDLVNLIDNLKEAGIRTNSDGESRFYTHKPDLEGNCSSCYSPHLNPHERCISLHIPSERSNLFARDCIGGRNLFMHYYAQLYKKFAFR